VSLLIQEGRRSREVARLPGHGADVCTSSHPHLFGEWDGTDRTPDVIWRARGGSDGLRADAAVLPYGHEKGPHLRPCLKRALCRTRTGDPFLTIDREGRDAGACAGEGGHETPAQLRLF
jgi:hypothetical protein